MTRRHRGRSRPRHPDRAARRRELLDAAIAAIRRDGPLVPMEAMAREAGVTKPILYRHFGDKRGLYRAIAEHYVVELMGELEGSLAVPAPAREVLESAIDAFVSFVERDPNLYRFLVQRVAAEDPEARHAVSAFVEEVGRRVGFLLEEQLRAVGGDTARAQTWGHGIVGMVQQAAEWWVEHRTTTRERLVEHLATLLWDGLGATLTDGGAGGRTGA